jgi:hypothetical protein
MSDGQDEKEPKSYEAARPYLRAAMEHMVAAGRSVRDMVEFSLERLGDQHIPHVERFLSEVREGQVRIKGMTKGAREALFGRVPTPEQRDAMIREAAYLRAERRGFVGGSEADDWLAAEQEVDSRIAAEMGLVERGRRSLVSVAESAQRELDEVGAQVHGWLAARGLVAVPETRPAEAPVEPEAKPKRAATAKRAPSAKRKVDAPKKKTARPKATKPPTPKPKAAAAGAEKPESATTANPVQEPEKAKKAAKSKPKPKDKDKEKAKGKAKAKDKEKAKDKKKKGE